MIEIGTDPNPIDGLVEANMDQMLQQSISGANIGPNE